MPVFIRLGREPGERWVSSLASLSEGRGGIFLFAPVMKWRMGIASRYSFVVLASTRVTIVSCEVFVRRWSVARFLFGMKPGRGAAIRGG